MIEVNASARSELGFVGDSEPRQFRGFFVILILNIRLGFNDNFVIFSLVLEKYLRKSIKW